MSRGLNGVSFFLFFFFCIYDVNHMEVEVVVVFVF